MSISIPVVQFSDEERQELLVQFQTIDTDCSGYIELPELKQALDECGFKIPRWKVREMMDSYDVDQSGPGKGRLSFDEFENLCAGLKAQDSASTFRQVVTKRENPETSGGISEASVEGTTHWVPMSDQLAISDWINSNLACDPDVRHLLPMDPESGEFFDKFADGILLCKLINHSEADTIDERVINKKNLTIYTKYENLTLALSSAQSIGINTINMDATDLNKGNPHLILGFLWHIIKIGLFSKINNVVQCPGLTALLTEDDGVEDLVKMSPEDVLLRWINHQLEKAGIDRRCTNLSSDLADSEVYTYLLKQVAPIDADVGLEAMRKNDPISRAQVMLQQADKLGCRIFLNPQDVVSGDSKLNLAFVANLFNKHPAIHADPSAAYEGLEETREEKTYRNWINSLGVTRHVNWLYADLANGLILFKLYQVIRPGIVDWKRVHKTFSKMRKFMEVVENCNYVVELGKELKFSLVGISGKDISDGNRTLVLALVWQLMKAYTLSVLTGLTNTGCPIVDKEIVAWVNNKLLQGNKTSSIRGFSDASISDARVVADLIDCISPRMINYDLIKSVDDYEDRLSNAKYVVSMARKIGARVYALPEDIAQVKPKMVMTLFATLMARDWLPNMGSKSN